MEGNIQPMQMILTECDLARGELMRFAPVVVFWQQMLKKEMMGRNNLGGCLLSLLSFRNKVLNCVTFGVVGLVLINQVLGCWKASIRK